MLCRSPGTGSGGWGLLLGAPGSRPGVGLGSGRGALVGRGGPGGPGGRFPPQPFCDSAIRVPVVLAALCVSPAAERCHFAIFPGSRWSVLGAGCWVLHPALSTQLGAHGSVHPESTSAAPSKKSSRCFHSSGKFLARSLFFVYFWPSPVSFSVFIICSTLLVPHWCLLAVLGNVPSPQTVALFSWCG